MHLVLLVIEETILWHFVLEIFYNPIFLIFLIAPLYMIIGSPSLFKIQRSKILNKIALQL